jgi:hypothetical protein
VCQLSNADTGDHFYYLAVNILFAIFDVLPVFLMVHKKCVQSAAIPTFLLFFVSLLLWEKITKII